MKKFFKRIIHFFPSSEDGLSNEDQYRIIYILPIAMLILAFTYNSPIDIITGVVNIVLINDQFATDYTYAVSTGAALVNSAVIVLINIAVLRKLEFKLNGMLISALFLLSGFAFVGKTLFNIWPFYIGGYIYARMRKLDPRSTIITSMFSTALAPIVMVISHNFSMNSAAAVIIGYGIGIFIGYVMPEVSNQILVAHSGYNIHNAGFAAGFLGLIANSILVAFAKPIPKTNIINPNMDIRLFVFFGLYFAALIAIGYYYNDLSFKGYAKLTGYSGRLITDFTKLCSFEIALINMGIVGLIGLAYVILMGENLNGPVIAGLLCMVGFASFGKHPKNIASILLGVMLASKLMNRNTNYTMTVIAGLFGTNLAPIVGEFGFIYGLVLGPIHLALVTNIGALHAGLNLYNNGLSGGIIAMIFTPVFDAFNLSRNHE